jgi:hypothetical protein
MFSTKIRHWVVAVGLIAAAGVTAESARGFSHGHAPTTSAAQGLPVPTGDLGEVVVRAPHDLGEIVVRAPHDLADVLVNVRPMPAAGAYLAEVTVTASRVPSYPLKDLGAATALAAVR